MEEINPLCGYEHRIIAELKKRLLSSSFQLESIKKEAELERKEHEEIVQNFIQLLSIAYQERDQLQKLVNKFMSCNNNNNNPIPDQIEPTPLLIQQPKPNLSITESNSEIYNNKNNNPLSHASSSSPADNNSFFDAATSPDFSTMNMSGTSSTAHVQDCIIFPRFDIDRANAAIEHLVKGKPLPQKGNLQQSVIDAGPLLYTLFMTGSIPQWKNPPPLLRPFINNNNNNNNNMQPSVKGNRVIPAAPSHAKRKADINSATFSSGFKTLNPALYDKNRRASGAVILGSMSNSAGGASASGWSNKQMVNSIACTNSQNSKDKRQRLI